MDDVHSRLERLERIERARVVGARYAKACDAKDVGALRREVFTDDVVLRTARAHYHGIEDVIDFYTAAFERQPGDRRHFLVNQITEVGENDTVDVNCYFLYVSTDATSVIGWGTYHDVVVAYGDDVRIAEKTISIDVATDLVSGWALASRPPYASFDSTPGAPSGLPDVTPDGTE